ncbi:hypothetical protein ACFWB9_37165, partial [Streptomyces sp. NPDC060022]
HLWAAAHLAPPGADLRAPHHQLYADRYRFNDPVGDIVPETVQSELAAAVSGKLPAKPSGRLKEAVQWVKTYGDAAREAVRALQPAHLIGLFLYTATGDFRLFKAHIDGSRFGDEAERWMLRYMVRKLARFPRPGAPVLLMHDYRFWTLAGAIADLDAFADLEAKPSPELELRVNQLVRAITDDLHKELPVHISMAAEALELLPPVNADVHWGGWMYGKDGELGPDDPKFSQGVMFMPRFRSATLAEGVAHQFMDTPTADTHQVLVRVESSTAPLISPFSEVPFQKEVLYGPGAAFRIVKREHMNDERSGAPYVRYLLAEMPSRPDPVYYNASGSALRERNAGDQADVTVYERILRHVGLHAVPVTPVDLGAHRMAALPVPERLVPEAAAIGQAPDAEVVPPAAVPVQDAAAVGGSRTDELDLPPRAFWNAPEGVAGASTVPVVRRFGAGSDTIGLASFSEHDWSLRSEAYGRLRRVAKYTQWSSGPGGESVAHEVSMPAFEGAFFFAVHGHPGGGFAAVLPDGETVVKDHEWVRSALEGSGSLRAAGFRNLVILSCGPLVPLTAEGAGRLAADLRALTAATGLSVFQNTGQVAVTPQEGGAPRVHLLEDSEGRPTTWAVAGSYGEDVRRLPTGGSLRLPAGVDPGERAWSVTGWRPTGSPESVRFRPLYSERAWQRLSARFEATLAGVLAIDGEAAAAARGAVERLHRFVVGRHGVVGADLVFFPSDHPGQGSGRLVSDFLAVQPGLDDLMAVFARAVHGDSDVALVRSLPGRIAPVVRSGYYGGVYGLAHDGRGFRYVGGAGGPALGMLQAYQVLGADQAQLTAFRKAVLASAIRWEAQSLHEVLRASHSLGLGDRAEHAALSVEGARLHLWAAAHLVPPGADLRAPHHQLYADRYRIVGSGGFVLPDTIQGELAAAVSGRGLPTEPEGRLKAAIEWLETYGDAAREAVDALQPSHLTALFLYSARDYEMFRAYVMGSRFGEAGARWTLRRVIRTMTQPETTQVPVLLSFHPRYSSRFMQLRWETAAMKQERALNDKGSPELDRLTLRVSQTLRDLTDEVHKEMPVHIAMAAEARELLPPVNARVYWGGWMKGSGAEAAADTPLITPDTLFTPRFRSTSLNESVALNFMDLPNQYRHSALVRVVKSTAPLIAPFALHPDQEEVLYGPGTVFHLMRRQRAMAQHADGQVTPYILYTVREMPPRPDPLYYNAPDPSPSDPSGRELTSDSWEGEAGSVYPARAHWNAPGGVSGGVVDASRVWEIVDGAGGVIGRALFSEHDWSLRGPVYGRLGEVAEYREWGARLGGVPVAPRRAMPASGSGVFFVAAHGDGVDGLMTGLVGGGVSHLMVVACAVEGDAGAEWWRRLQPYADAQGFPVSRPTGAVAVVRGPAKVVSTEGDLPPIVHLLEDAQGRPTRWVTVRPGGGFDMSMLLPVEPPPRTGPPGEEANPWSVPGWRPAGAAEGVRFAQMYADPEWQSLSVAYEKELAWAMASSGRGVHDSLNDAFDGLWELLVDRHGEPAAFSAFYGEEPKGQEEVDRARDRFSGGRGVMALMSAFARAVYDSPSDATLIRTMPGRITAPRGLKGDALRAAEHALTHTIDGFRHVGGRGGPARALLQAYQILGPDLQELKRFRDHGVIPWVVLTGRQSLHEALRDSHELGLGDEAERTALSRDGARLHLWARDHFVPSEYSASAGSRRAAIARPEAPHHQLYAQRHQYNDQEGPVPGIIESALAEGLAGPEPTTRRGRAVSEYLLHDGEERAKALLALRPAHLTALYLYTRPGIFELLQSYVKTNRFGEGVARWRLQARLLDHSVPYYERFGEYGPLTLARNPAFLRLVVAAKNRRKGSDHVLRRALNAVKRKRKPADFDVPLRELASELMGEIPVHIDMIAEALDILPPENNRVWFGGALPGRRGQQPKDSPVLSGDILVASGIRSTSKDFFRARNYVVLGGEEADTPHHPLFAQVEQSSARDVSFVGWGKEQGELLLPPGTVFDIFSRDFPRPDQGLPTFIMREMPSRPDLVYYNASGLSGGDGDGGAGERVGAVEVSPYKRMLQQVGFHALSVTPVVLGRASGAGAGVGVSAAFEWSGPRAVRFEGRDLELVEVAGSGDRLVEALVYALRHGAPWLLAAGVA